MTEYLIMSSINTTQKEGFDLIKTKLKKSILPVVLIAMIGVLFAGCSSKTNPEKMNSLILSSYIKLRNSDSALVNDTTKLSLDLENMGDMKDGDREKLRVLFGEETEKEIMFLNVSELIEKGEINQEELYWKDGVIYTFKLIEDKGNTVKFSCNLWRSGLGAIGHDECVAKWNGESWDIDFGSSAKVS